MGTFHRMQITTYQRDDSLRVTEWDICKTSPHRCLETGSTLAEPVEKNPKIRRSLFEAKRGEWGNYYTDKTLEIFDFIPGNRNDGDISKLALKRGNCPVKKTASNHNWNLSEVKNETTKSYRGYKNELGDWFKLQPPYDFANNNYLISQAFFEPTHYHEFLDGRLPVEIGQKWGFADESGKVVFLPVFDEVTSFNCNLALVTFEKQKGIIDQDGNWVIELGEVNADFEIKILERGIINIFVPPNHWDRTSE